MSNIDVGWPQLKSVCMCRMHADCLTNHPGHPLPYDDHCDEGDCECSEATCPVWRQWKSRPIEEPDMVASSARLATATFEILAEQIVEMITNGLVHAECAHDKDHGCLCIWSSGAHEQIATHIQKVVQLAKDPS